MNEVSAIKALTSLALDKKAQLVAALCHEMTILARDTYGEGNEVKAPSRLRTINELEHRMTGLLMDLLEHGDTGCPHEAIVKLFFTNREDKHLQRLLLFSFERVSRLFDQQSG